MSSWEEELIKTGKTIFCYSEIFYCEILKAYFIKKNGCEIAKSIEELREIEKRRLMFIQERTTRWENGYGKYFE
jgi:hypothetical protein